MSYFDFALKLLWLRSSKALNVPKDGSDAGHS